MKMPFNCVPMKFHRDAGNGCGNKGSSFLTRCLTWKATLVAGITVFILFFYLLPFFTQRLAMTGKPLVLARIAMEMMNGGFLTISRQLGISAGLTIVAVALLKRHRRHVAQ